MEEFRDLYRRLHGATAAFPETNFSDDHGDEVETASAIEVGESAGGTLDYMFDFDFFRFHAEEGQRYRMNVNHESLRATSVTLYAPDGLTQEFGGFGNWKSRRRVSTGPQILWMAPSSGQYYFAVQNFGGKTGPYTLTITAVDDPADDHGDTLDTATDISLGEVVGGVVEDDFDYDYFRFRAVEGRRYRVSEVTGGTLEYFLTSLYAADGVAPANWPWNKWNKIRDAASSDGHWFEWVAPNSKEYYIASDGAHGSVGTYRLRIFSVDNQPGD